MATADPAPWRFPADERARPSRFFVPNCRLPLPCFGFRYERRVPGSSNVGVVVRTSRVLLLTGSTGGEAAANAARAAAVGPVHFFPRGSTSRAMRATSSVHATQYRSGLTVGVVRQRGFRAPIDQRFASFTVAGADVKTCAIVAREEGVLGEGGCEKSRDFEGGVGPGGRTSSARGKSFSHSQGVVVADLPRR